MEGFIMISIFFAKLIGLYFVIIAIALLTRYKQYKTMAGEMAVHSSTIMLIGMLTVLLGLVVVLLHNFWILAWPVVITIIGWLILLGGIMRIFFADYMTKMALKAMKCKWAFFIPAIIMLIVGLFLIYHGFFWRGF